MATLFRFDGWVRSAVGPAAAGAAVYLCGQPANVIAPTQIPNGPPLPPFVPSPLAQIFSDVNGLVPVVQPLIADGFGHYDAYVLPGTYALVVMLGGRVQQFYLDQSIGLAGSLSPALTAGIGISIENNVISSTGGGAVSSVFGRVGAVVSQIGDYSVGQITGAAPLDSPVFTNIPTAPTAAPLTSTLQLATTQFVTLAVAAAPGAVTSVFGRTGAVTAQSSDYSYAQISSTPQLPLTKAAITSNFLTSYTSGTGQFTAAQPAASDLSNGTTGSGAVVLASAIAGLGGGSVTSVSFTGGLISVATPTTTPALTVAGTSGGIPYFSSTSAWASSALLAATGVVIGGGSGTAPATSAGLTYVDGATQTLTIGLAGSGSGVLALAGTTSGTATITGPAVAGTRTNSLVFSNSIALPNGTNVAPSWAFSSDLGTGMFSYASQQMGLSLGGSMRTRWVDTSIEVGSTGAYTFDSTTDFSGSLDTGISRVSAGVIAVGNGSAGSFTGTLKATTLTAVGVINTGAAGGTTGTLNMLGSTSGTVTIKAAAAAGTFNFNLPTTAGSAGQFLTSGGGVAAAMTWTTPGTGTVSVGTANQMAYYSTTTNVASLANTTVAPGSLQLGDGSLGGSLTFVNTNSVVISESIDGNGDLTVSGGGITVAGFVTTSSTKSLTTQFDKTTTTLGTYIESIALLSTLRYRFRAVLYVNASVVGGGKYSVAAGVVGALTATDIIYQITALADAGTGVGTNVVTSRLAALGGTGTGQSGATSLYVVIEGTITVNAGGSLAFQFAQNAANGTSSVLVGSTIQVERIP